MEKWRERYAEACFRGNPHVAHDLKTPLNVAVLNLELLRIRLRKVLEGAEDPKIEEHARAIDVELRRLAKIFDGFFTYSIPPVDGAEPEEIDLTEMVRTVADDHGLTLAGGAPEVRLRFHEGRARELVRFYLTGSGKIFQPGSAVLSLERGPSEVRCRISGARGVGEAELVKVFKFYYSDTEGKPDLSLACAGLIADTFGGRIEVAENESAVTLDLVLPTGDE